jgi:hypothetical protein
MIKQFIGIVFTSAILFSCSNDIEEYMGNYPLQGELNGFDNTKETKSARLIYMPLQSKDSRPKTSSEIIVDDEKITVYGCDRFESKKRTKVSLSDEAAKKFGLSKGIYVVEYILCYKNVYKAGYDIWSEESKLCGYKPSSNFVLGNSSIGMEKERGYEEPASNARELKTFLIHVISDISGKKMNLYDPCTPNEIEWIYSISSQQ